MEQRGIESQDRFTKRVLEQRDLMVLNISCCGDSAKRNGPLCFRKMVTS